MIETVGVSVVAVWLGVSRAAVSNYLTRFTNYPPPAVVVTSDTGRHVYGWTRDQRAAWVAWDRIGRYNDS